MRERHGTDTSGASRREFLKGLAALGVGGWAAAGCARAATVGSGPAAAGAADAAGASAARAAGAAAVRPTLDRIGVGLFTVFGEMRQDFDGTLEQIARIGYKEVEFAGYYGRTPEQVRQVLDRVGLRAPSTHIGLELLRTQLDAQVGTAQTVGHRYITVPSLPRSLGAMRAADDWKRVAEEFNRLGRTLQERGVRLAFHNHSSEFVDVGGGRKGMDVFIAETDPALVSFELDLGWTRVAGEDPAAWFARYPGRFPMWHVKDIKGLQEAQARQAENFRNPPPPPAARPQGAPAGAPAAGGPPAGGAPAGGAPAGAPTAGTPPAGGAPAAAPLSGPAPLGQGEVDYRPIFAAWQASGLEHYFVEQDGAARWPGGALESLRTSYDHVRRLLA